VEGGAVPIDRFEIGGRRRDLHEVVRRAVKGAAAADAEIRAVARISASACGSIMPGGGGGATAAISSGRFSHWSVLKTVKRLRNGIACASSPFSRARFFSSSGMKRSA